jgi:hypothetical protein
VEPELPQFVGHVWMNGGPWLIADRLDAQTWTGIDGDYQKKILPLTAWETEISVGDGGALVLSSDYDDSTIEVYRVSPSELLIVGVRYADDLQPVEFLKDAAALDLVRAGRMDVRSGALAIFESALAWTDGIVVEGTELGGGVEHNGKILVTPLTPGSYELAGREVDRDEYGLAVWRLRSERSADSRSLPRE